MRALCQTLAVANTMLLAWIVVKAVVVVLLLLDWIQP